MDVDQNIPIPEAGNKRPTFYPWDRMRVGDSFGFPLDQVATVRSAAHKAGRTRGMRFSVRKLADEGRCWRVE